MAAKTNPSTYVGFDTIPHQIERKLVARGFCFNLMVVGRSGLGKTTFVNTLFASNVLPPHPGLKLDDLSKTTEIVTKSHVMEEKGVQLKLSVTDTPGFGDQLNNDQCWEPITRYIKEQYSIYLRKELTPNRERYIQDTRIHCVLYFLQPSVHGLTQLDLYAIKRLSELANVVPVIAKSDTLTIDERQAVKRRIKEELKANDIVIYPLVDTSDELNVNKQISQQFYEMSPFAIVGSDKTVTVEGKSFKARTTKWGIVNVENEAHCDFIPLRNFLVRTHLQDLVDTTSDVHYESFRTRQLLALKGNANPPAANGALPAQPSVQ